MEIVARMGMSQRLGEPDHKLKKNDLIGWGSSASNIEAARNASIGWYNLTRSEGKCLLNKQRNRIRTLERVLIYRRSCL